MRMGAKMRRVVRPQRRIHPLAREWSRREVLRASVTGLGFLATSGILTACAKSQMGSPTGASSFGPLGEPDENGLRLPPGFTARVVARSGEPPVQGGSYRWPAAPDGGATFKVADGWIYVANSEVVGIGGVAALRFDSTGSVVAAYPILTGTNRNCAGGTTPWGTWLSCEEIRSGRVWECDPLGEREAIARPALGVFNHEAVVVDAQHRLYLTEDESDGCLYRFTPAGTGSDGTPDLDHGTLEVAEVPEGPEGHVLWHEVPDPSAGNQPTRAQVSTATIFDRGEGMWFHRGVVYFTTTGDDRVWAYDTEKQSLAIVYDDDHFENPELTGVDNVVVARTGDVLVAEDGGNMQIVAITASGAVVPVVQLVGHPRSEVTGPAFDPSGKRLYFSSQRGATGNATNGVTYEVSGPF